MCKRVAKFEKVSLEQFIEDCKKCLPQLARPEMSEISDMALKSIWERIKLPKRATKGSAGYDFFLPFTVSFSEGEAMKFPTGIRCNINEGWMLQCFPRSGLGFKHKLTLDNTVGIIDQDYYFSDNEGHIHCKMTKNTPGVLILDEGKAFMQGILLPYGIAVDDDADGVRNGGFGSTDSK